MLPRSMATALALAFSLAGASALEGCILAAGAAGAGGGYALSAERPFTTTVQDAGIGAAIAQSWKTYNPRLAEDLGVTVYDGRALLTGTVPSEAWRGEAVKRAWQADGVKEVYDEIQLGPDEGFFQDIGDDTVTNKLKAQLIADGDVKSINYSVTTVNGIVYIIGTARSQGELNRVIDHARNIANVKRVISYVRIRSGEPQKPEAATAAPIQEPPPPAARAGASVAPLSPPTPRQEIQVTPLN
ncbi:MAG: BON domain-containing protein [Stellaceae bacterium]